MRQKVKLLEQYFNSTWYNESQFLQRANGHRSSSGAFLPCAGKEGFRSPKRPPAIQKEVLRTSYLLPGTTGLAQHRTALMTDVPHWLGLIIYSFFSVYLPNSQLSFHSLLLPRHWVECMWASCEVQGVPGALPILSPQTTNSNNEMPYLSHSPRDCSN